MTSNPPVRDMIRRAMEELGGTVSNTQLREEVLRRYPDANPSTINTQINFSTVNMPSRIHSPENLKPRVANDSRYDVLFRVSRGRLQLYDPKRHGVWEIVKGTDGRLHVGISGEPPEPPLGPTGDSENDEQSEAFQANYQFALERQLRDFIVTNIKSIAIHDSPLSMFVDDRGQLGVEYPTDVGRIDILALDDAGDFVVFELKLGHGLDAAVGQLMRYMGWVKLRMARNHAVSGVIVAQTVDKELRYAAAVIPNISLYEYSMSFSLEPVGAAD